VRRLVSSLRMLFRVEGSPTRVAAAFGLGIFIAFFPILGIHTGLALLAAFALRLNKVAILTGAWVNNPWTVGPMYLAGTLVGCGLVGVSPASLAAIDWSLRGRAFYASLEAGLRPLLLPFVVGNLLAGTLCGLATFFVLRSVLRRRRGVSGAGPAV
jgi:uncharacterized protein (DUF2062 family)